MLAGAGLMVGAFDYNPDQCPPGYSTHTFQDRPTQCWYVSPTPPYDTDVREATVGTEFRRPALLWSGLGAATVGVVLFMLPRDGAISQATRDLNVQIDRSKFEVSRSVSW